MGERAGNRVSTSRVRATSPSCAGMILLSGPDGGRPVTGGVFAVPPRRDLTIESLRAVAIVLMAAGHVIGADGGSGLTVADDSLWRYSYVALEDIRMPLFTVLSGFVYAYRPTSRKTYRAMATGKARRLIVPLFTVGVLFFLAQSIVPGVNSTVSASEVWRVPVYGYGHFWFVLALFLIFLTVGVLDTLGALDRMGGWAATLATTALLYVITAHVPGLAVLSVNGALRLLPFFLLGYGLHRFTHRLDAAPVLVAGAAVGFSVAYAARIFISVGGFEADEWVMRILKLVVGVTAVYLIMAIRPYLSSRPLAWLGQFAFSVYLLHVFGAAATRIALGRLGVDNDAVAFGLATLAAIAVPVLFEMTFGRVGWVSWTFLGQKPWRPSRSGALPRGTTTSATAPRAGLL